MDLEYRWELSLLEDWGGGPTKKAFTLVEMLIVVLVIGILWAAILPKFSWYLERTRDIKRQADLRNIGLAIEAYKAQHHQMPKRTLDLATIQKFEKYWTQVWENWLKTDLLHYGYASALQDSLISYLTSIPLDPNKKSQVLLFRDFHIHRNNHDNMRWQLANWASKPGEYVYETLRKNGEKAWAGVLIAKVETPDMANYVYIKKGYVDPHWSMFHHPTSNYISRVADSMKIRDIANIHLCLSVKKVSPGKEYFKINSNGSAECAYSSADQLYYIYKIE